METAQAVGSGLCRGRGACPFAVWLHGRLGLARFPLDMASNLDWFFTSVAIYRLQENQADEPHEGSRHAVSAIFFSREAPTHPAQGGVSFFFSRYVAILIFSSAWLAGRIGMPWKVQRLLGPDYDVIPEFFPNDPANDHIHIEYDPKPQACK